MSQGFSLRPYQHEAIEAVSAAQSRGVRRMLVCLPTGAGKTVIFSHLASRCRKDVMVLAHREELLEQARDKIARSAPVGVKVEIEQGALKASAQAKVIVASIRSLRTERLARLTREHDFGLVIYDECHHATAEDNKRVLRELGVFDAGWRGALLGFTATTQRADGIGLEEVFDEIVYSRSVVQMIEDGYLVPLRGYRVATEADITRVGTGSGQDFQLEELAEAVDIQERNALVARSIQELARDRRTLVFCVTVQHARHLKIALNVLGVKAGLVHGEMKSDERAQVLADFREGKLQALTNVAVLTEGFDDPAVSCVAMARPTKSQSLYVQCVGRGTRLAEGKTDCLVLDFADVSEQSVVTLPSLYGMPREFDLEGEDAGEVAGKLQKMFMDVPGFEWEAGAITLAEIQRRAESFDPLTLDIDPELRAISGHAWCSLGSSGLVLHVHLRKEKLSEYLILDSRRRGKERYQVMLDQAPVATFSQIQEAVAAVDWEVEQRGPLSAQSARPEAAWRQRPPPPKLVEQLQALTPPRSARTTGEAMHYVAFGMYARKRRPPRQH